MTNELKSRAEKLAAIFAGVCNRADPFADATPEQGKLAAGLADEMRGAGKPDSVKRKRPEASVVAACLKYLRSIGAKASRISVVGYSKLGYRTAEPGFPDIVACVRGRYVAVECKSDVGRQSPQQAFWQRGLEAAGGIYVLARSVENVERAICKIK